MKVPPHRVNGRGLTPTQEVDAMHQTTLTEQIADLRRRMAHIKCQSCRRMFKRSIDKLERLRAEAVTS